MLTDIFYYDYYKPYIVKETGAAKAAVRPKTTLECFFSNASGRADKNDKSIRLNKADKKEIVEYAFEFAKNVNNFKDAARIAARTASQFSSYARRGIASPELLSDGLENFADCFNNASHFTLSQNHSPALKTCATEQEWLLVDNAELLSDFGLSISVGGLMTFDGEALASSFKKGRLTYDLTENLKNVFEDVYSLSAELMRFPMSEHMEFRELRYYYNYQPYITTADTFRIIESGLIVDIAI